VPAREACFSDLFVIASHSASRYKGTRLDVRQIGHELGVRYLLLGSVRREAVRIRITAQLIHTGTGAQVWAEHYDRELTGIFAVQDEVTQRIVVTLVAHVTRSELTRALRKPPETLAAYDYYLARQCPYEELA
jgi:adenylate cyclase